MNLLAGDLFGFWKGFPLVCFLTAAGASCNYWISNMLGATTIRYFFPQKVKSLTEAIQRNRENLFFYLLFIRMVPFTPNWLLNMVSPILNIPFHLFFFSILFGKNVYSLISGLMPYNFVCVQAGSLLSELTSLDSIFDFWTLSKLFLIALASLIPILARKRFGTPTSP